MAEEYTTNWKTILEVSNTFLSLGVESPDLGELVGLQGRSGGSGRAAKNLGPIRNDRAEWI